MRQLLLCFLAGLAISVSAQDTRGRISGIITDSTEAVVTGAAVTLTNDNTGVVNTQETTQVGQFVFDFVNPGTYTLTVEMSGFRKYVQRNILVQARGNVNVNAKLEVGAVGEQVTVEAAPVAVQFNTATMSLTIDQKMANNLPIIHRNPFLLVSLNPAVVLRSTTEQSPFHHWAASQFDVGGNTNTKNDIILDGAPSMTAQKSSYTPPMDAVSEVNLQQNAVDAEFGHSAGGVLAVQMKSGTNDFHGTAYYLGRNPALNARANPLTNAKNLTRQHTWGLTSGNPILRNKLFNFFSYEGWRTKDPRATQLTLPTALERRGDFSQSLNNAGGLRAIYDPWTTVVTGSNTSTRQPFANNTIPASRIDPTSSRFLGDVWEPNNPGVNTRTGLNNFTTGFAENIKYWNLMDRVDWNASDKLKTFFRYSQFKTFVTQDNYVPSPAQPFTGSERHARSYAGDVVYTLNPSTVINVRGSYNAIVDSFEEESRKLDESAFAKFWDKPWYQSYFAELPALYYPAFNVRSASVASFGRPGFWFQEPDSYNVQSKVSRNQGRHYYKVGGEYRNDRVVASRPRPMVFEFRPNATASTIFAPQLAQNGDAWATFLLGALDGTSAISSIPIQRPISSYLAFYVHDDIKLTQRLTVNLGFRYEYYSAMKDPTDRISRFLDLNSPIPELQGITIPAAANRLRTAAPVLNGAWVFADENNRGSWNAPKALFLPRAGMAYRVNDKTSFRAGYARYIVPADLTDSLNILGSVPYPGFDATTNTIPEIQGVPQQRFSDPFPGGLNPVVGKGLGRYTNLGSATTWYNQNFQPGVNDRINFSLNRELPARFIADITYFLNFGRNSPYTFNLNQVDPRIGFANGSATTVAVPNPFFGLPANIMPGQLRTRATVPASELLRAYPQYGNLTETVRAGVRNRYQALQMQFQRPFVNGFNLVIGYNYNRERRDEFYDEQDAYLENLTLQNAPNARHRITGGGIYELPFGRGRRFMGDVPRPVDWALGGWSLSGIFTYNTGFFLRFGSMLVNGDPVIDNPTNDRWFDTSVFARQPAFTRRSNPLQFDGLTGPGVTNLDLTLAKEFKVTERFSTELRMESYNVANNFKANDPGTDVNNPSTFGRVTAQRAGMFGRQFQYSLRLRW